MHYLQKHGTHEWLRLRDWGTGEHITRSQGQRNVLYHACKELEFINVAHEIFVTIQLAKCNKYILKINTPISCQTNKCIHHMSTLHIHCKTVKLKTENSLIMEK